MDAATVERLKSAGWPWDALSEAVFARIDAQRSAAAVAEDGAAASDADRAEAAFELEGALWREQCARGELADVFLLLLRSAVRERPNELTGLVMAAGEDVMWREVLAWLANAKPGGAEQWLETSRRIAGLEEQVARLRAENWELACAHARLKLRIEGSERVTDATTAQDHGPSGTGGADREGGRAPGGPAGERGRQAG